MKNTTESNQNKTPGDNSGGSFAENQKHLIGHIPSAGWGIQTGYESKQNKMKTDISYNPSHLCSFAGIFGQDRWVGSGFLQVLNYRQL